MPLSFNQLDVDAMELNQVYQTDKLGKVLFVVVPPGHIEKERAKTSINIDKIIEKKRKFNAFIERELYIADWREKNNSTREHRREKRTKDEEPSS